jgi:ArsR family transcriptional regulator, arsenate/arsenite/antimonite-responsive transcriptional repressor
MFIEVFGCGYARVSVKGSRGPSFEHARATLAAPGDGTMKRSEVEKISKALADETRLRIFEAISATDHMNCGEIVSMRGVTAATVSHHLKILSEAGLITCRREGQFVYSQTVSETITAYTRALAKIARGKKLHRG